MTQTSLEIAPAAVYSTLVTFTWGSNHIARYCRWTSDITVARQLFTHEPSLKVLWDRPEHGAVEDSPHEIQMAVFREPFDTLDLPWPHARVLVEVQEISPGDDATLRTLFRGRVGRFTSTPEGQSLLGKAQIVGVKKLLDIRAGTQALSSCDLWLGHPACGYDLAANSITGTIIELNTGNKPNRVTIDLGSSAPDMANERWNRGYLEIDGLRITTRRSHDDGLWTFDLREIPPPDWLDQEVLVVPGCDKKPSTCAIHGRTESFRGSGIGMPNRNPVIFPS